MPHPFQQGQTYFSKNKPPISVTPYGPKIQTHESMDTIPIQITIKVKQLLETM